jgi:tRNA-binding protein
MSELISYDDFQKVEMRVGRIVKIEDFPKARKPAYKLWIDLGEFGIKKSSAQVTKLYTKEDLLNKLIVVVANFPVKQIADFQSEVLVLGSESGKDTVVLLEPGPESLVGSRVF